MTEISAGFLNIERLLHIVDVCKSNKIFFGVLGFRASKGKNRTFVESLYTIKQ